LISPSTADTSVAGNRRLSIRWARQNRGSDLQVRLSHRFVLSGFDNLSNGYFLLRLLFGKAEIQSGLAFLAAAELSWRSSMAKLWLE
jgi:hypothetical protein